MVVGALYEQHLALREMQLFIVACLLCGLSCFMRLSRELYSLWHTSIPTDKFADSL